MTFLYGTNMELLYSMPAIGTTQTSSVATVLNTSPVVGSQFQLPAFQNIWSPGNIDGRGLMIVAAGGYDVGANTLTTLRLSLDTAAGTTSTNIIANTGAFPLTTQAVGAWEAQVWMTCTGITNNTGATTWFAGGTLTLGPGSAPTGTATTLMWGQPAIVAGVPTAITLGSQTPYFCNLVSQFQVSPTAMVCTQFMVFGLN
jgi:hypothetical protein